MNIREKLADRLNNEINSYSFSSDRISRLYCGYLQRAEGAWSWYTNPIDSVASVGSQFSMKECVDAKYWYMRSYSGDLTIFPHNDEDLANIED
jgi:hypothetical protein